jgi:NAD(P) transhydrogenase subunit beta
MSRATATDLVYLVAIVGFILALKGLSSPKHARLGNLVGAGGMLVAVAWTFSLPEVYSHTRNLLLIIVAIAIGAVIAVPAARLVKMTAMPQMVAIFNGVGGGAAALVSVTEFISVPGKSLAIYKICEILFGVLVGSVSLAGSAIAFAKLQELMTGRPITYPAQQPINAAIGLAIVVLLIVTVVTASTTVLVIVLVLSLALGAIFVLPIGGADTPVLISLLNAFTGLAVAASGFTLDSTLLIVAGTLVGASGTLLTRMMSQAMGRSLPNILFSAFGSVVTASGESADAEGRSVRSGTADDIGVLLAYARKVAIIPGYGLAVAQAQHTARELADALAARGVEVYYAIHPVAGRMPGHMNVLLAEANVPYDQLEEMDDANLDLSTTDVALVVGANDTVNPAAKNTPGSPIYGMPIINADQATNIVFLKRSMRPGFAGIDNELLYDPKTTMLFGDAKDSLSKLVAAVKAA